MTIFTSKLGDQKEELDYPCPEVVTETVPLAQKKDEASVAVVALSPPRRRSNLASICVLLTALTVFAIGILGGIYLYNRLAHKRYTGWCGVTEIADESYYPVDGYYDKYYRRQFEEHFEIDQLDGMFERLDVPEFAECKQATILHDFDKNQTAIVDKDNGRCFLIPLNRTMVKPPRDFWDLLSKLRDGYYLPDTVVVRENYRVVTPRIEDLSRYGYYIAKECRWYDTYRMVHEGEPVAMTKRSACEFEGESFFLGSTGMPQSVTVHISSCI